MKEILFNALKKFAALALALGCFQIMASLGAYKNFQGILYWSPGLLFFALFLFILNKVFNGKRKFEGVVIFFLIILGFTSASYWGHKAFEQQMDRRGIKIE